MERSSYYIEDYTKWETGRPLLCPDCREEMAEVVSGWPLYLCPDGTAYLLEGYEIPEDFRRHIWMYDDSPKTVLTFCRIKPEVLIKLVEWINGEGQS